MPLINMIFAYIAAVSGFLATAFGAFGAHGLKHVLTPEKLKIFETANFYHFIHTFLILIFFLVKKNHDHKFFRFGTILTCTGLVLFSGSLYLYSVTGLRTFAYFAPFGGLSFMLSWLSLLAGLIRISSK